MSAGALLCSMSFGQWIAKDSTLSANGVYGSLQWGAGTTITIPAGVSITAQSIGGGGELIINGNLDLNGGSLELYGKNSRLLVGAGAVIKAGQFSTSGS